MIYKVLYISGGCLGFLNHQQYVNMGSFLVETIVWSKFITLVHQTFGVIIYQCIISGQIIATSHDLTPIGS